MESRFSAMLVLWLEREFYKIKHGLTGSGCSGILDPKIKDPGEVPASLATWREIWRQIDDSRKCNPFLDISIRKKNMLEYTRKLHVTSRPVGETLTCIQENVEKLHFADNTFDEYTIAFGYRNVSRIEEISTESSLPDDTLRAWQRFRAINRGHRGTESSEPNDKKESTHRMDLDGLLSFLLDEIEGEERVYIATKCFTKNQSPKPWNTKHVGFKNRVEFTEAPSASTLIATSEKNPNVCIFCSGIHESGDCFKARKMSSEERQKAVQNSRSCFLCLEKEHVIAKCRRKTSCVICGKKHHILLCRNIQSAPVSVNIRKDESKETVTQRDETLANLARTPNVLLQTLMVTLRGRDKKRQYRRYYRFSFTEILHFEKYS
ncbi:hypothetical protein AVEN_195855-1 [Araneus ventricosus]|uniref:Peptidase aspartic putative domain-containing protein n=1 Tax=Araneus ventricosus TaxID=182803 RepID=A0A4Y2DTV4_ARAVE|nr:hypothetical protein AVEN_195855-1 [Araneus ventricosus]